MSSILRLQYADEKMIVKVGEEGAGTVEKVWGGRFTDLRFSLSFHTVSPLTNFLSKGKETCMNNDIH